MIKNAMYFGKRDLYNLIKRVGGEWNDTKDRPIFCCIESLEHKGLYWAIPVGNYNHRDASAKRRINNFINLPPENIASCYYHIGQTTIKSIFFISDVITLKVFKGYHFLKLTLPRMNHFVLKYKTVRGVL